MLTNNKLIQLIFFTKKKTMSPKEANEKRCIEIATPWQKRSVADRVQLILGWTGGGGVQKRIDENRELYELLSAKAPDFMDSHPWVASWLQSHDEFFCALAEQVPVESERFRATPQDWPGRPFPRPMFSVNACWFENEVTTLI